MPLGAIPNAELDAEIDAEPHKQHGKGNGDKVEPAHRREAEGRGQDQAQRKCGQNCKDELAGAQAQPQQQGHCSDGDQRIAQDAVGQRGEFLIGQRN